ncbi:MAG: S-layer homology domain-containing protein [bacterium]
MDYCPDGDASPSYYDDTCIGSTHTIAEIPDDITTSQLLNAYKYAREHELITAASSDAKLYAKIKRKELAKLISIYVKNVVGLVADPARKCDFSDLSKETTATRAYIKDVCKLGIMGVHQDGKTPLSLFKPNTFVTRAEVATVLSRVLFADTYNTPLDSPYKRYALHLAIFKNKKLIQNISQPDAIDTK